MLDSKGCYKWSVFAFKYTWRLGSGESPTLDNSAKVLDISKNQTKTSFTISVTFSYITLIISNLSNLAAPSHFFRPRDTANEVNEVSLCQLLRAVLMIKPGSRQLETSSFVNTVDGKNPANQLIWQISHYFTGFHTYQVVVWDVFHQ